MSDEPNDPAAAPNAAPPASERSSEEASADAVLYPDDQPDEAESLNADAKPDNEAGDKAQTEKKDADSFELHMPPGIKLDGDLLGEAMPVFREAGVSKDQAQKLVPLVSKVQERFHGQMLDDFEVLRSDWSKQAHGDREIGGEHMKETRRLAGVALEAGGAASLTHEFRELLDDSGIGNHPSALRVFRRMGAEIERLRKQVGVSRSGPKSREETLYPNDPPKR